MSSNLKVARCKLTKSHGIAAEILDFAQIPPIIEFRKKENGRLKLAGNQRLPGGNLLVMSARLRLALEEVKHIRPFFASYYLERKSMDSTKKGEVK
ncbi:MAG: hypothetical protein ACK2U0_19380 [Candidatus Promineifilaceae bacterium]|jgi:hypothetical protein